jgi:hypothetical protein
MSIKMQSCLPSSSGGRRLIPVVIVRPETVVRAVRGSHEAVASSTPGDAPDAQSVSLKDPFRGPAMESARLKYRQLNSDVELV